MAGWLLEKKNFFWKLGFQKVVTGTPVEEEPDRFNVIIGKAAMDALIEEFRKRPSMHEAFVRQVRPRS